MPPRKASRSMRHGPPIDDALLRALKTISKDALLSHLIGYFNEIEGLREKLQEDLVVQDADVVRYEDFSSENAEEHEERTSGVSKKEAIVITDDELTPRYNVCLNCKQEFDVTTNEQGDCLWHSGRKEVNFEEDYWADHDPDCHGDYSDFEDDPDMAEGFMWSCCREAGDGEGCHSTKHKAKVNMVVAAAPGAQKRKAGENGSRSTSTKRRK